MQLARQGVTLRSRSGDPRDVVIDGAYGSSELVQVSASGITVAEVTLTRARDHLVHAFPPEGGRSIERLRLYRVRLVDSGEQFVKANQNVSRSGRVSRSSVECSSFRMTAAGARNIERAFGCYTGGIDAHGARRWHVRRNRFQGIYCEDGEVAEHAVHFWRRASGTLVENNLIVNCARGIGFGLTADANDRHTRGVIRRNAIIGDIPQYDSGIEIANAPDVRVLHNTVVETGRAPERVHLDRRALFRELRTSREQPGRTNQLPRWRPRAARGNIDGFPLGWLRAPARGDVHLRRGAGAIDAGVSVARAGRDLDGASQPRGRPDVGADERGG